MTPSGPTEIMAAIARGMATVTNLSASTVNVNGDFTVRDNPYSMMLFPWLGGRMEPATMGSGWNVTHRIKCKLTVRSNNAQRLSTDMHTMISLVLTWFRANDQLGLSDVETCSETPLQWDSPTGDVPYNDGGGVLSREVDFVISVKVAI
jgi:hypothetical protein